jgi:hypothetical protein
LGSINSFDSTILENGAGAVDVASARLQTPAIVLSSQLDKMQYIVIKVKSISGDS